jgi:hypothetical protein
MSDKGKRRPDSIATIEARRITFAAARVANHAARELTLLERATRVHDDEAAREFARAADAARSYCVAISEEHGLQR